MEGKRRKWGRVLQRDGGMGGGREGGRVFQRGEGGRQ